MTAAPALLLDGRLVLWRGAVPAADAVFARLRDETAWLSPGYVHAGGVTPLPRLTANYGERSYDYRGFVFAPQPWTPLLRDLKALAEQLGATPFNAAILQQYRDGADRVRWHADDDPAVGVDPVIVSLSFGATRAFHLKAKADPTQRLVLDLHAGDVLVMRGDLQHTHLHAVPRQPGAGARINITFRRILDADATSMAT